MHEISRRKALTIGGLSTLGLSMDSLPALASPDATIRRAKAKSVILFWLLGGPPQHETWDPKPDAVSDVRGEFGTIATQTPGLTVGELMPMTAKFTEHFAVLRAVQSNDNAHSSSGYQMLTGVPHSPRNRENATAQKPNFFPSIGGMVRKFLPEQGGLPSAITIPRHIANDGEIVWPGQTAGFLGARFDPWLIPCDPSAKDFRPPQLKLQPGLSQERLADRRKLLASLNRRPGAVDHFANNDFAFDLLAKSGTCRAFEIERETEKTRERYGRTRFGQSVLLARRLVETGVKLVQVNWTRLKDKKVNNGTWDTHAKHNFSLKDHLMPIMDRAFSALIEDLSERGLLDETLVVWAGEFGRTPKFNKRAGRDHWGKVYSMAFAGAGIRGGTVHGKSNALGAEPVSGRVEPRDITATILQSLGIPPGTTIFDDQGRQLPLCRGEAIRGILA